MKKIKLKPCPFCGGMADVDSYYSNNGFFDEPTKIYKVFCQDCLCQTDEEYIKDKAIESWNKRVVAELLLKLHDEFSFGNERTMRLLKACEPWMQACISGEEDIDSDKIKEQLIQEGLVCLKLTDL